MENTDTLQEQIVSAYNALRATFPAENQGELAQRIGINRSTLSRALNGDEKYITWGMLRKIQEAMGRKDNDRGPRIPFFDMDVTAGIVEAYTDTEAPAYTITSPR